MPNFSAPSVRSSDRQSVAIIVALLLAQFSPLLLTSDPSYLILSTIVILVLGAVTALLRRFRVMDALILVIQLVLAAAYLFSISVGLGSGMAGNIIGRFGGLYLQAIEHMRTQAAPMAPDPGVKLLFVSAVALIFIFTDAFVQSIQRPVWSIVPLSAMFLVPALGLKNVDQPWWAFLAVAVGYLLILLAEGVNTAQRWPRGVRRSEHDRSSVALAWRLGAFVAVPGIILTMLLAMATPTLSSQGWGFQKPKGADGPLTLADPTLDLRRNLNQPEDRVVMVYKTDQENGAYMRMASLPVFNAQGWSNAGMSLTAGRDLPPAPGYRSTPGQKVRTTDVQISDFRSEYLPMPYAPDSFNATGEWGFDKDSLVVIGTGENRSEAIKNLHYSVKSVDIQPDGPGLAQAEAGNPPDSQLTRPLPQDVPDDIINLALRVTNDAPTPALKAAAIQAYLRSGEFVYSTEPQPGTGYQAIENFLFKDKKGYCEQYASSMAIMARVAGIPSRIAVGFLPGEKAGENYEVSVRDMHAWPELYFEGYGWVRFEPTPSVATPPPWTVQAANTGNQTQGASASATPAPGEAVSPTPEPEPTMEPTTDADPVVGPGIPWGRLLGSAGLVAALALAACTPMLLRRRSRDQRLQHVEDPTQRVENAWDEVRDSILDYGQEWPVGSPRVQGELLAHDLDGDAAESARDLSLMVERARFARHHEPADDLTKVVGHIHDGLDAREDSLGRFVANWWPRSIWVNLARKLKLR